MTSSKFPAGPNDSTIRTFDDPVPAGSSVATVSPERCTSQPHSIEKEVQRCLARQPGMQILTLSVHRLGDGVCLQGTIETDRVCPDLTVLLQEIAGVETVVNRLRIRQVDRLAAPLRNNDDTAFM